MSAVLPIAGFVPSELSSLVRRRLVDEHAGEAGFLWAQRQRAVTAPHFRLVQLQMLDARVQAHLAALRVAGDEGWRAALRAADPADTGSLFTLARCAFDSGQPERMRHALAVALTTPEGPYAVAGALAWGLPARMHPLAQRLLQSPEPLHRRIGAQALRHMGLHDATTLERSATDTDAGVRAIGLRALGEQGLPHLLPLAQQALQDPDPICAFHAAWSAAVRGDASAARRAMALAPSLDPALAREAVEIALRRADLDWARATIRALAANAGTRRLSIIAAGALGDPVVVPWLIEFGDDETLGPAAGEALSMITGVDLRYLDLDQDPLDDEDSPLAPQDQALPRPDPARLRDWWRDAQVRFPAGQRHLAGQPVTVEGLATVLRGGYQRQRAAAAIELAGLRPEQPLYRVERRADRQAREWAA